MERQAAALARGERVVQETRGWHEASGKTVSQRLKEESQDYRYFPEPDIPPLRIEPPLIEELRRALPELPAAKLRRFREEFGIEPTIAETITRDRALAAFFEAAVSELKEWASASGSNAAGNALLVLAANYLTTDIVKLITATGTPIAEALLTPENFAELITYLAENKVSSRAAKEVLQEMFKTGSDPSVTREERGLWQISDDAAVDDTSGAVIAEHKKAVEDYQAGNPNALQFLVGQVMKRLRGANPEVVRKRLEEKLKRD